MAAEEIAPNLEDLKWGPLLEHLTWLHEPDAEMGQMVAPAPHPDGGFTMGFEVISNRAQEVVDAMYATGVVGAGVDWARWLDGAGESIAKDRSGDVIAEAPLDDVRRLLVAIVRGARFNEGLLLEAFRSGTVRRLLERAKVLTES